MTLVFILLGAIGLSVGSYIGLRHINVSVSTAPPGTFTGTGSDLGRRAYAMCMACHGAEGHGIAGYTPGLVGSTWLTGDPRGVILITLHGLDSSREPGAMYHNARMNGFRAALTDAEVAALLTWLREQWGHHASAINAAQVNQLRSLHERRLIPWTPSELHTALQAP